MSKDKKSLEITILGNTLEIQCLDENISYLEDLAFFVDSIMKDISDRQSVKKSDLIVAILTCLNIADTLKKESLKNKSDVDNITKLRSTIASRSSKLISLIDDTVE